MTKLKHEFGFGLKKPSLQYLNKGGEYRRSGQHEHEHDDHVGEDGKAAVDDVSPAPEPSLDHLTSIS